MRPENTVQVQKLETKTLETKNNINTLYPCLVVITV